MGSWSVSCGISNIAITSGDKCCIIPLVESFKEYGGFVPTTLPIFGEYDDYGGMENIIIDDNTKLIESVLGITIDKFVKFLVDGKFTYNRDDVKPIVNELKKNNTYEMVKNWRFMWVNKDVYDFMSVSHDVWHKGFHDFGTKRFLDLFGFVEVNDEIKNYHPKRFNKKYKKGDQIFYSDGKTLLSDNGQYVYYTDKKDNQSSLSYYFEIPNEFKFIGDKMKHELWRFMSPREWVEKLSWVFGGEQCPLDDFFNDEFTKNLIDEFKSQNKEIPEFLLKEKKNIIYKEYFKNMDVFGDLIAGLINVKHNLYPMSSRWFPHVLYLTPQCGEHKHHQILLEGFAEINKKQIMKWGDENDDE